jgi:hypothetical protein
MLRVDSPRFVPNRPARLQIDGAPPAPRGSPLREPSLGGGCSLDPTGNGPVGSPRAAPVPGTVGPSGGVRRAAGDRRGGARTRAPRGDRSLRSPHRDRRGLLGPPSGPPEADDQHRLPRPRTRRSTGGKRRCRLGGLGAVLGRSLASFRPRPHPLRRPSDAPERRTPLPSDPPSGVEVGAGSVAPEITAPGPTTPSRGPSIRTRRRSGPATTRGRRRGPGSRRMPRAQRGSPTGSPHRRCR